MTITMTEVTVIGIVKFFYLTTPSLHSCEYRSGLGFLEINFKVIPVRSPLLRESQLFSFPLGTEMFHFPRLTPHIECEVSEVHSEGFPHSDISGSKVATHLPGAYRRYAASFIATWCQGIRHPPLFVRLLFLSITSTFLLSGYSV